MRLHNTLLALLSAVPAVRPLQSPQAQGPDQWTGWGGNTNNNRWNAGNCQISSANIQSLTSHCKVSYPIGVSATPVLSGNAVYYPTWNGSFVAFDYTACRTLWLINVTAIVASFAPISDLQRAQTKPVSRTSPQVDEAARIVYFGTQTHALVVALDQATGHLLGTVQVNPHPLAILTMSPTLYDGRLFIGSASGEESAALDPTYECCSFVGNVVALSFDSSKKRFNVLWNETTIPEHEAAMGWSGAGVWGSQPSIDATRRQVFFATGNTYNVPDVIIACQNATANITAVAQGLVPDPCLPRDVLQESVLAIDIDLGILNWVHQLPALDAFTLACGYLSVIQRNASQCPQTPGPDADFGMAPTFVPGIIAATPYGRDAVILGQKGGILYAFSAQAGTLFWATAVGPGGLAGGLSWGVAVDDARVYYTVINSGDETWHLQPSGQVTNRSAYGAANLSTGEILWETAVPGNGTGLAPPTVVGDLVLVGKTGTELGGSYDNSSGSFVALDKATGKVLMDSVQDTNFHGGVAVYDEYVFYGLGYAGFGAQPTVPGSFNVLKVSK